MIPVALHNAQLWARKLQRGDEIRTTSQQNGKIWTVTHTFEHSTGTALQLIRYPGQRTQHKHIYGDELVKAHQATTAARAKHPPTKARYPQ